MYNHVWQSAIKDERKGLCHKNQNLPILISTKKLHNSKKIFIFIIKYVKPKKKTLKTV